MLSGDGAETKDMLHWGRPLDSTPQHLRLNFAAPRVCGPGDDWKTLTRLAFALLGLIPTCIMWFSNDIDRARVQGLKGNDGSGPTGLQG